MDQQGRALSLQLSAPANAPIGLYRLSLEASTGYQGSSFVLGHFNLLFNTWCPGEPDSTHERGREVGGSGPPTGPTAGGGGGRGWCWLGDGAEETTR